MTVRINIHPKTNEKDDALVCNWCGELHAADSDYIKTVLERGKQQLEEMAKENPDYASIKPEETWICGRCLIALKGIPAEIAKKFKTDCHEHEVPQTRVYKYTGEL